jgi:tripartite-type tricarboxylate transporter receptor subunit TctC
VLNQADLKNKLMSAGVDVVASSPQQFANHIKGEVARIGKVVKAMGLRQD